MFRPIETTIVIHEGHWDINWLLTEALGDVPVELRVCVSPKDRPNQYSITAYFVSELDRWNVVNLPRYSTNTVEPAIICTCFGISDDDAEGLWYCVRDTVTSLFHYFTLPPSPTFMRVLESQWRAISGMLADQLR